MIKVKIDSSQKLNCEYSIFVSFPFDSKIVSTIREFPFRYWNADCKEWELPYNKLEALIQKLPEFEFKIYGKNIDNAIKTNQDIDFKFKTKPFRHQLEGFKYGLTNDKWLLGDEQGLGKTKQVIDIAVAKKLQKGYTHCLIICGVNGLKWNWQEEIKMHSDESGYILGQRQTKSGKIKVGISSDKLHDLKHLDKIPDYFLITNIETLRNTDINSQLIKLCKQNKIQMIAADEIHKMKNPTSQQGKAFLKLQAQTMVAMTGTPLMNYPLDLYIILRWLGYETHAFGAFKRHYCNFGGFGGYEIIGYKNLEELQEKIAEIMLRRLKDDVLDLPEKIFVNDYVEMTPKQSIIYKEATSYILQNIDRIKTSINPLAELIRMRQATGYTGILSNTIKESAKLDRLEEIVEDNVANNKKVIIFSNWTQMTAPIYERLSNKYKGLSITGDTKDRDRQKYVNEFQTNKDYRFIVGTIGAMGTGLTLNAASTVIFVDEPWTMAAKSQAIDRAHRIGTNHNVTVVTLMCKNTIDERIHELVEKKGAMADVLIDGNMNTNRADVLEFLLS